MWVQVRLLKAVLQLARREDRREERAGEGRRERRRKGEREGERLVGDEGGDDGDRVERGALRLHAPGNSCVSTIHSCSASINGSTCSHKQRAFTPHARFFSGWSEADLLEHGRGLAVALLHELVQRRRHVQQRLLLRHIPAQRGGGRRGSGGVEEEEERRKRSVKFMR